MKSKKLFLVGAGLLFGASFISAATIDIISETATYIRPNSSNKSKETNMYVGQTTTANDYLRGILSFNLSDPVLAGATIEEVTLTLTVIRADGDSESDTVTLDLHELTQSYAYTEVTWDNYATGQAWTNPGGDYSSTVLASTSANPAEVVDRQAIEFTDAALTSAVSSNIGDTLDLIAKLSNEGTDQLRRLFLLRSSAGTSDYKPVLSITYSVPEPAGYASMAGVIAFGFVFLKLRRRR